MGTSLGAIILAQPGNPGCIVGAIYAPPPTVCPQVCWRPEPGAARKESWRATSWGPLRGFDLKSLPHAPVSSLRLLRWRSNHPCPIGVCLDSACALPTPPPPAPNLTGDRQPPRKLGVPPTHVLPTFRLHGDCQVVKCQHRCT